MADKTFTIECTMSERWADQFLSMLDYMRYCGHVGRSEMIGFYADGDGDFHPEFSINDIDFKLVDGVKKSKTTDIVFDAG